MSDRIDRAAAGGRGADRPGRRSEPRRAGARTAPAGIPVMDAAGGPVPDVGGGAVLDAAGISRRRAMLAMPHMRALAAFAAALRQSTGRAVPDADPLDGGIDARVLLLLETPGPGMGGDGFVSRDNPTGTARNIARFADAAGLPRERTLIWNAVPWRIHAPGARNRAPRAGETRDGIAALAPFLALLPTLEAVVLAGRVAAEAAPLLARLRPELAVFRSFHPSPTIVCTAPAVGAGIVAALTAAARGGAAGRARAA